MTQNPTGIKQNMSLFRVSAIYESNTLKFSPTAAEVKEMLFQKLTDGTKMIYSRPMLADEEKFKIYMSTLDEGEDKDEGKINPLKTIEESEEVRKLKAKIEDVLDVAFSQLESYDKDLVPFIKVYNEHCALDFKKLEGQPDPVYRLWVEQFEKDKIYINEKLEGDKVLGVISVDAKPLKDTIAKKPKDSRDQMEKNHRLLRENLQAKGYAVIGEFTCPGFNTNLFLKHLGGLNKGRPNEEDLERAEEFARGLKA